MRSDRLFGTSVCNGEATGRVSGNCSSIGAFGNDWPLEHVFNDSFPDDAVIVSKEIPFFVAQFVVQLWLLFSGIIVLFIYIFFFFELPKSALPLPANRQNTGE